MILDSQTTLSMAQLITGTAISTNVLDLTNGLPPAIEDEGLQGRGGLVTHVQVGAAFNTLTTLTVTLESDSTPNLATAPVVHWSSGPIALAALVAGAVIVRAPWPSGDYKRYAGLRYVVQGSNPSQGSLIATLNPSLQARGLIYANGFLVR